MARPGGVVRSRRMPTIFPPQPVTSGVARPTAAFGLRKYAPPPRTRGGFHLSSALAGAVNRGGFVRSRSNLLVLLGIAFFVVGGVIVCADHLRRRRRRGRRRRTGRRWSSPPRTSRRASSPTTSSPRTSSARRRSTPPSWWRARSAASTSSRGATFTQGFQADQQITSAGAAAATHRAPSRSPRASRPWPCSSTSCPAWPPT